MRTEISHEELTSKDIHKAGWYLTSTGVNFKPWDSQEIDTLWTCQTWNVVSRAVFGRRHAHVLVIRINSAIFSGHIEWYAGASHCLVAGQLWMDRGSGNILAHQGIMNGVKCLLQDFTGRNCPALFHLACEGHQNCKRPKRSVFCI